MKKEDVIPEKVKRARKSGVRLVNIGGRTKNNIFSNNAKQEENKLVKSKNKKK